MPKMQIHRVMLTPNCQHLPCKSLMLITMTLPLSTEPSIFRKYGLGAHNAYTNPIGMFLLELLPESTTITPPNGRSQCYLPNSTIIKQE
jgi:hypothetical protein